MKKSTKNDPNKKRKTTTVKKAPMITGIGGHLERREMASRKYNSDMDALTSANMKKKNTSKLYAPIAGSTDPMKKQNKRGKLVPTKMAKQIKRKSKK